VANLDSPINPIWENMQRFKTKNLKITALPKTKRQPWTNNSTLKYPNISIQRGKRKLNWFRKLVCHLKLKVTLGGKLCFKPRTRTGV